MERGCWFYLVVAPCLFVRSLILYILLLSILHVSGRSGAAPWVLFLVSFVHTVPYFFPCWWVTV